MTRRRLLASVVTLLTTTAFGLSAEDGSVRVSAARANIRAEATEKSGVLVQVTAGTVLILKAIEGDWFKVELPPDPRLGGVRVQGYLSRKVGTVVAAPSASATVSGGAAAGGPAHVRGGMSVALQMGATSPWLIPEIASVRAVDPPLPSLRALIGVLPMNDVPPAGQGAVPVTHVWVLAGATAPRVLETRKPTFLALYKDLAGFAPGTVAPLLVRLTPAPSGIRLVGAARGRADQAVVTEADWEVMRDFRQDPVRATVETPEPGASRIVVGSDLDLGEYAVVFRPTARTRIAGHAALSPDAALFRTVWAFSIR